MANIVNKIVSLHSAWSNPSTVATAQQVLMADVKTFLLRDMNDINCIQHTS